MCMAHMLFDKHQVSNLVNIILTIKSAQIDNEHQKSCNTTTNVRVVKQRPLSSRPLSRIHSQGRFPQQVVCCYKSKSSLCLLKLATVIEAPPADACTIESLTNGFTMMTLHNTTDSLTPLASIIPMFDAFPLSVERSVREKLCSN